MRSRFWRVSLTAGNHDKFATETFAESAYRPAYGGIVDIENSRHGGFDILVAHEVVSSLKCEAFDLALGNFAFLWKFLCRLCRSA